MRRDKQRTRVDLPEPDNPMMMKGPIRAVFPAGRQTVSVAIPKGKTFRRARLLVAGGDAGARVADGRVEVEVPGVETLEVVHLNWS